MCVCEYEYVCMCFIPWKLVKAYGGGSGDINPAYNVYHPAGKKKGWRSFTWGKERTEPDALQGALHYLYTTAPKHDESDIPTAEEQMFHMR